MPDDFERHWMSAENAVSFIMLYFSAQNNVRLIHTPLLSAGEMPRTGQTEQRAGVCVNRHFETHPQAGRDPGSENTWIKAQLTFDIINQL